MEAVRDAEHISEKMDKNRLDNPDPFSKAIRSTDTQIPQ